MAKIVKETIHAKDFDLASIQQILKMSLSH